MEFSDKNYGETFKEYRRFLECHYNIEDLKDELESMDKRLTRLYEKKDSISYKNNEAYRNTIDSNAWYFEGKRAIIMELLREKSFEKAYDYVIFELKHSDIMSIADEEERFHEVENKLNKYVLYWKPLEKEGLREKYNTTSTGYSVHLLAEDIYNEYFK